MNQSKLSIINEKNKKRNIFIAIFLISLIFISTLIYEMKIKSPDLRDVNISQMSDDVSKGLVKSIEVTPGFLMQSYKIETKSGEKYITKGPILRLTDTAQWTQSGVELSYAKAETDMRMLPGYISVAMISLLVIFTIGQSFGFSPMDASTKSDVKFDDVGGSSEAKMAMQEVVAYLKNPKKYESIGARFPKGIIMDGPPGTGKTLLAKAVAGEAGANFLAVSGSDFSSKFLGVSGMKVRQMFNRARRQAPCVLFIDEIDALGGKRLSEGSAVAREMSSTLNSLLVQMDGFEPNSGVIVIAATNRIELLDPALLRSGRFDRHIHVQLPGLEDREFMLRIHAKGLHIEENFDFLAIAKSCIGMSGADMSNVINQAALIAVNEGSSKVSTAQGIKGRDRVVMGDARLSQAKSMSADTKRILAIHEVGHALMSMVHGPDKVSRISIIPRGLSLGQTMLNPSEERFIYKKDEMISNIRMLLGGRAAEIVIAQTQTTGAYDDLRRASQIALDFVGRYGMSKNGILVVEENSSESHKKSSEDEAKHMLNLCLKDAQGTIIKYVDVFNEMVEFLIINEEIDQDLIYSFISKIDLIKLNNCKNITNECNEFV